MKAKNARKPGVRKPEEWAVRVRVICRRPPSPERAGAVFGLQERSAQDAWVIHPGRLRGGGDVEFECECRIRRGGPGDPPRFLGPWVHGAAADRFLYLSWRPVDWRPGDPDPPGPAWLRRMKVSLRTITWSQVREAVETGGILEASVAGTARDGGPACGSVALDGGGWKVAVR